MKPIRTWSSRQRSQPACRMHHAKKENVIAKWQENAVILGRGKRPWQGILIPIQHRLPQSTLHLKCRTPQPWFWYNSTCMAAIGGLRDSLSNPATVACSSDSVQYSHTYLERSHHASPIQLLKLATHSLIIDWRHINFTNLPRRSSYHLDSRSPRCLDKSSTKSFRQWSQSETSNGGTFPSGFRPGNRSAWKKAKPHRTCEYPLL